MTRSMRKLFHASVAAALAAAILHPVQAALVFDFGWQGDSGYSARGSFGYDETTAPAIIVENGAGPTIDLDFLSVAFFDPSSNPLQSFDTVVGGVSSSTFFAFSFDTTAESIIGVFNVGGGTGAPGEQWLSRNAAGLMRLRAIGSPDVLLDQQDPGTISVTRPIPEPGVLLLIAVGLGLLGLGARGRRKAGAA